MDAAATLANHLLKIQYEDLPAEVIAVTRRCILDLLGVMLPASSLEKACQRLADMAKEGGGKEESTIVAFGGKVPCWMAAFVNGAMCHPMDYDDTLDAAGVHPTAANLPAAFAIAERVGKTSGRELITAVALANDLVVRLALALERSPLEYGWSPMPVFGCFSAAAAAGKLLGLTAEQMTEAFGLALNQAAGSKAMLHGTGSDMRAIRDGFSAKTGVLSALMAQKGITGGRNSLEGKDALYDLYFQGEYDPAPLTVDLGQRFEGAYVSFKPWPSCRQTHPFINATLDILRDHDVRAVDVAEIVLTVGTFGRTLCEPLEERRQPRTSIDAKASLPFAVGVAVTRRNVVMGDFLPQGLEDQAVLQVARKVSYRFAPEFAVRAAIEPGAVEIRTGDGKSYRKRIDLAYGHPSNPISPEHLTAKFRDCAAYSVKPLSRGKVDELVRMVADLEKVEDVGNVMRLLG